MWFVDTWRIYLQKFTMNIRVSSRGFENLVWISKFFFILQVYENHKIIELINTIFEILTSWKSRL